MKTLTSDKKDECKNLSHKECISDSLCLSQLLPSIATDRDARLTLCSPKILMVDDNIMDKISIKCNFNQYQFDCDDASNGHEAVEMVKARLESG